MKLDKRIKHKPLTCFDTVSHLYGELALFSNSIDDFTDLNTSNAVIGKIHLYHTEYTKDGRKVRNFMDDSPIFQEDWYGCSHQYHYCLPLRWVDAKIRPYRPKEFLKKFPVGTVLRIRDRVKNGWKCKNAPLYSKALITHIQNHTVIAGGKTYTIKQLFESMSYTTDLEKECPQFIPFIVIEKPKG